MTPAELQLLVDSLPQLAWTARPDGYLDWYNRRWYEYTGTTPAQMEGWGWQAVHDPKELPRVLESWRASIATEKPFELAFPLRGADGAFRWFLTQAVPIRDEQGTLVRWFGTNTNIEAQRRAEEQQARRAQQAAMAADVGFAFSIGGPIRDSLQRCCQAAVDHLDAAFARIWTLSADGTTLELKASAGLYTHLDGAHARVPVGQFKIGLVAAERKPHLSNDVSTDPRVGDHAWARREGMVSFAGYPLLIEDTLVGVLAMFARHPLETDALDTLETVSRVISVGVERKRNEIATRTSEAQYRFLSDFIPTQVWTATPDGMLDYVNRRALDYFGSTFADTIGAGWTKFVHPDDLPPAVERWTHSLATGELYEQEFRLRTVTGEYRWHIARAEAQRDAGNLVVRWFGTNSDVEDRKRAEREHEQLIFALGQSNQELDRFAYVASHDLKAPLRGIHNLAEWIEEDLGERVTPQAKEQLALLRGRVQRMSSLVDGVLDYSRVDRKKTASEELAVGPLVAGVIELLAAPGDVKITVPRALPTVWGERVPLQQVFLNLIGNAVKHAKRSDARIEVAAYETGASWDFVVSDNGPGIDPQHHDRVWGIFQTLNEPGQPESTGIGLAVVKKLVEARGGRVWIESSVGHGARFHFLWPKRHERGA